MSRFQKKKELTKIIHSRAVLVILIIICLLLGYSVVSVYGKSREAVHNRDVAVENLKELKDKQVTLQGEINDLNTPSGVEDAIRDKFRAVKDGEGLIVIVDNDKDNNPDGTPVSAPEDKTFWQTIEGFITGGK